MGPWKWTGEDCTGSHGEVEALARRAGQLTTYRADRLLVATGPVPNTDDLGLKHAGVRTDERGFVVVDEYLRTTAPNVWAAGDVIDHHVDAQMATPVPTTVCSWR
ncbi:MAG: FAD-dependent oxidoreductase [Armatimonadota bacterium]|nr:FAD-dependent oxidoreductase [Armatimonadota bacterium]